MDAYAKRTGRDATHAFAVGDADTILARVAEYVDAGVSKFILRPLGGDDDAIVAQTRLHNDTKLIAGHLVRERRHELPRRQQSAHLLSRGRLTKVSSCDTIIFVIFYHESAKSSH